MIKIVILGDSLSLPRPENNILFEDTYPYLLSTYKNILVINRSKRANDTNMQSREENLKEDILYLQPNFLIIHLGIVDCAPRVFTRFETYFLIPFLNKFLFGFGNFLVNLFSKYRYFITKLRKIHYVEINKYYENLKKIIQYSKENVKDIKIILIKILNTNEKNEKKSYMFNCTINNYNKVIDKIKEEDDNIKVIDLQNLDKNLLLDDGIHLNKEGHLALYNEIINIIFENN
ncbi:MAG: SGNH/GDSL hydrolase family protein [Spirochaetes bacterium]|nr:SGNH/GDSL hydrolase family protein [Spirochaetota bacterium]